MVTAHTTESVVATLRAAGCVFAEDEAALLMAESGSAPQLTAWLDRRVAGEPLEQVLGWALFCGLRIGVQPGVFVPRRRTEFLVEQAAARCPERAVLVDLCCGSAAVAIALARTVDPVELHAADLDPVAIRCARTNMAGLGEVHHGDLYSALPDRLRGRIDVLTANVPYVPTHAVATLPPEARLHETRMALDGGADGLDVARRVVAGARGWLSGRGTLLFEASERQRAAAHSLLAAAGLTPQVVACDEWGTVVVIGTAE